MKTQKRFVITDMFKHHNSRGFARYLALLLLLLTGCGGGGGSNDSGLLDSAQLTEVQVSPPTANLAVGTTQDYTATAVYDDGSTEDVTDEADWTLTSDPAIFEPYEGGDDPVDEFGIAIAMLPGTGTLMATFGGFDGASDVKVQDIDIDIDLVSITISPRSEVALIGTRLEYEVTGVFSNDATYDLTDVAVWGSSNESVATISNTSPTRGVASALAAGTAVIHAAQQVVGIANDFVTPFAFDVRDEPDSAAVVLELGPIQPARRGRARACVGLHAVGFRSHGASRRGRRSPLLGCLVWQVLAVVAGACMPSASGSGGAPSGRSKPVPT